MSLRTLFLIFVVVVAPLRLAQAVQVDDDLSRGLAVLREKTPLYQKPDEASKVLSDELDVELQYFVLGLSLDGQWTHILTRRNVRGWVRSASLQRLRNADSSLELDYQKLVKRHNWRTNRFAFNFGAYPAQDLIGEMVFTLLPRGIGGLKGETLDLVGGATLVKATADLPSNVAYRALLQWPFRMGVEGNFHMGPRIGYEMRQYFDPTGITTNQRGHFVVAGLIFRYMPNPLLGFSFVPEFVIGSKVTLPQAFFALTLML